MHLLNLIGLKLTKHNKMTENVSNNENELKPQINTQIKDLKRNFYDFRNIYKIEDFYCFSDNNSYFSNLHPNTSRSQNSTFNSDKFISSFKKNISTYLIIKKHYEANSNKYFTLVSKLKHYKEKKRRKSLNNILINDDTFDEANEIKENVTYRGKNEKKKVQIQMPLDIMKYSEIKKINERNLLDFEFIIEEDGDQKKVRKKINLNHLESKFLKKHEGFLNNPEYSKEYIIEQLSHDFEKVLEKIKFIPFFIKMPKHLRPLMQSFNDFYLYDESYDPEKNQKPVPNVQASEIDPSTKEKQENIERQLDEVLIDQILQDDAQNNLNETSQENDQNLNNEKNGEISDEDEDENEKDENPELNSRKVLKKMQKYLDKKPIKEPTSVNKAKAPQENLNQIKPPPSIKKTEKIKPKQNSNQKFEENKDFIEEKKGESIETPIQNKIEENKTDEMLESEIHLVKKSNEDYVKEIEEGDQLKKSTIVHKSRMELIDKLLESKDIFNEDLSELRPKNFEYPEIPKDLKFNDDNEKEIFQKVNLVKL